MKILEWVLSVVLKCWLCDLSLIKKKEWCLLVILNSDFAFNLKLKAKSQLRMTSGHHSFFSINVKLGEVLSNEER